MEMLSGRLKKDYAADARAAQENGQGLEPADGDDDGTGAAILAAGDPEADELEVAAVA